jgi:hypothetical protein
MILAVNVEDAIQCDDLGRGRVPLSECPLRSKADERVLATFQNLLMHMFVARAASALSASCINVHRTLSTPCAPVNTDRAALQFEGSVDGVQYVLKRPTNRGSGRVEMDIHLVRRMVVRSTSLCEKQQEKDAHDKRLRSDAAVAFVTWHEHYLSLCRTAQQFPSHADSARRGEPWQAALAYVNREQFLKEPGVG